jgi:hypothetical protein
MAAYPEYQGTYASMMLDGRKVYDLLQHTGSVEKIDIMEALVGIENTPMRVPNGHHVKFVFPVDVRTAPDGELSLLFLTFARAP